MIVDYPIEDLEFEIWNLGKVDGRRENLKFQFLNKERIPIFEREVIRGMANSVSIDYDVDLIPLLEKLINLGKERATTLKMTHNHDLPLVGAEYSRADLRAFRTTKAVLEEARLEDIDFERIGDLWSC